MGDSIIRCLHFNARYINQLIFLHSGERASYNKSQQEALFLNFILVKNSACFGQIYCPSSEVLILYSQQ